MKKWWQILWVSREEKELEQKIALRKDEERIANKVVDSINLKQHEIATPDPDDLTIENAYKTRWIWYHTILAGLMFLVNLTLLGILILLAVKL
tara:strand:- start:906 stop:1184 length:279 start_codon:yes stop_codon:yes gene_type:complete